MRLDGKKPSSSPRQQRHRRGGGRTVCGGRAPSSCWARRREAELAHLAGKIGETGRKAKWLAGDITHPGGITRRSSIWPNPPPSEASTVLSTMQEPPATWAPIPDMTTETWEMVIATNLTGGFHAARHQIPAMRLRGGGGRSSSPRPSSATRSACPHGRIRRVQGPD